MSQQDFQDYKQFFIAFRNESDRACAVLARALLEDLLNQLFDKRFIVCATHKDRKDLMGGQGPLATFSARIRLAKCLGMITSREAHDLDLIRDIGNDFAHSINHEIDFDDPAIKNRVLNLSFAKSMVEQSNGKIAQDELNEISTKTRRRFEIGVGILWVFLMDRISRSESAIEPKSLYLTRSQIAVFQRVENAR